MFAQFSDSNLSQRIATGEVKDIEIDIFSLKKYLPGNFQMSSFLHLSFYDILLAPLLYLLF